jgi:hypothetical protein
VGIALAAFPDWSTALAGFGPVRPVFFARQAGVFHLVLAELRRGSVTLLVTAKAVAAVFLLGSALTGPSAWAVPFSGAADGVMGLAVAWLARRNR